MENVHLMHSQVSHMSQDSPFRIFLQFHLQQDRGGIQMLVSNKQLDVFGKEPSTRPLR